MHRRSVDLAAALVALAATAGAQPLPLTPDTCRVGYVWREAFDGDLVCVTPRVREQAAEDNSQAASRVTPGAHGPATCRTGYVWRDAFPGDTVCVTPATRDQAAQDNRETEARRQPASGPLASPYICRPGYVWRLARVGDKVCVTREVQAQTRRDNRDAAARRGSDACKTGYVWREAGPQDYVCVTPETREQARYDNQRGPFRTVKACDDYARLAVRQHEENLSLGCGFSGDRWQANHHNHFHWCIAVEPDESFLEMDARGMDLARCRPQPARPPSPSQGGGTPPTPCTPVPSSENCCYIPQATPSGAVVVVHTCGPPCPPRCR